MSIKQFLYSIKQNIVAKNTEKITVGENEKIVVADGYDTARFAEVFGEYRVVDSVNKVADADLCKIVVYFGAPKKSLLKSMSGLNWLQLSSAGLNGYDDMALYSCNPTVTTAKGIYGYPISECVIGDILFLMKPAMSNTINKRHSIPPLSGKEFFDSTVAVCGLGDIGRKVAERCKGLKCKRVIGLDNYSPDDKNIDEIYGLCDLPKVIGEADVVVSALPDLPETRNLFCAEMFVKMKKGAIFVNVGRGTATNQKDLEKFIKSGHIFGAALDVTTPDPLPKSHFLRRCKRVIITDHLACISENNRERLLEFYIEQGKKYINGELV